MKTKTIYENSADGFDDAIQDSILDAIDHGYHGKPEIQFSTESSEVDIWFCALLVWR